VPYFDGQMTGEGREWGVFSSGRTGKGRVDGKREGEFALQEEGKTPGSR